MSTDNRSINGRTLATINVISSWVVNTYYNYLHHQASNLHTTGRSDTITDGYKFIVRQYLNSFNDSDGYRRNLLGLHKYYMDNTRYSSIPFDAWIKDILAQFVPTDYFSIMSTSQQDMTLRGILVGAITQFSSDIVCNEQTLDTLIMDHDNTNLVPIMKKKMISALLFERQKLFQALFKSSTGGSQEKPMEMMRNELTKLIEENVMLKHKNVKCLKSLKGALAKMKERDMTIAQLMSKNTQLEQQSRHSYIPVPRAPPPSPQAIFAEAVKRETGLVAHDDSIGLIEQAEAPQEVQYEAPHEEIKQPDESENESFITEATAMIRESVDTPKDTSTSEIAPGNENIVGLNMAEFLDS